MASGNKYRFGFLVLVVRVSPSSPATLSAGINPSEVTSVARRVVGTEGGRNRSTKNLLISPIGVMNRDGAMQRAPEGTILDMNVFSITANNEVRVFASEEEAPTGEAMFGSAEQLAALVHEWPLARLVEVWNQLPGAKQIRKFSDRKSGVRRLWQAVQGHAAKAGQRPHKATVKRQPEPPTAKPSKQGRSPDKVTKTETILALLRQPSGATLTRRPGGNPTLYAAS